MQHPFGPIYANAEAVRILAYPKGPEKIKSLEDFLAERIQTTLLGNRPLPQSPFVREFMSGRRRYVCRVFSLDSHAANSSPEPAMALVLKRSGRRLFDASQLAAEFDLTPREQETLGFLVQGLTNKEIATRMRISPNTVKAFLKLIMIKMEVTTRSGIVGKTLDAQFHLAELDYH